MGAPPRFGITLAVVNGVVDLLDVILVTRHGLRHHSPHFKSEEAVHDLAGAAPWKAADQKQLYASDSGGLIDLRDGPLSRQSEFVLKAV